MSASTSLVRPLAVVWFGLGVSCSDGNVSPSSQGSGGANAVGGAATTSGGASNPGTGGSSGSNNGATGGAASSGGSLNSVGGAPAQSGGSASGGSGTTAGGSSGGSNAAGTAGNSGGSNAAGTAGSSGGSNAAGASGGTSASGGTQSSASGGSASGGSSSLQSSSADPTYATSGAWHGYIWPAIESGAALDPNNMTTITPTAAMGFRSGGPPYCVSGHVPATPNSLAVATIGMNTNQNRSGGAVAAQWPATGTGIRVNVSNRAGIPAQAADPNQRDRGRRHAVVRHVDLVRQGRARALERLQHEVLERYGKQLLLERRHLDRDGLGARNRPGGRLRFQLLHQRPGSLLTNA
ncbi:MAG: hypothetical protein QM756_04835 [Polyangiaceae bacterium]